MDIPNDVLKKILELRKNNGLEATEAAMIADLTKSKAKWTLMETARYRRAGRSPLFISGRYLSSVGIDPATGERDSVIAPAKRAAGAQSGPETAVDAKSFYRDLHERGFAVQMKQDLLSNKLEIQVPAAISKLALQFGRIGDKVEGIHVIKTAPQIQVAMSLDKFLEIAGIKPA